MIFHRLGLINKDQRGFTFVEVVLAITIASIITGGVTMTIFQVITGNIRTSNHMTAVRQVQSAGYWVSRDAQMVQIVGLADESVDDPDGTRFPLTLTWEEWEEPKDNHEVVYTLVDMTSGDFKNLRRSHTINDGDTETGIIAEYINPDPAMTSCDFSDTNGDDIDDTLTFTVTATVGAGSPYEQSETRVYEVVPRPEQ